MRTNRSAPPPEAAPISAGVVGRVRRTTDTADPDGNTRAQLLRLVALLGIGLVAAAILLPSGEAPVVVPDDALQPATAAATAAGDEDAPNARTDAGMGFSAKAKVGGGTMSERGKATFGTGSSAASVAGDDLPSPTSAPGTPDDVAARATTPGSSAARKPAAKRRAARKTRASSRRSRQRPARAASSVPAAAPPAAPTPAATPAPAPAPVRSPAPRRARGGPTAEFGGL